MSDFACSDAYVQAAEDAISTLYTDTEVKAAQDALDEWLFRMHGVTFSCCHDDEARGILDAVAPLIAAKALRDLAEAADNNRLLVLDGGSSYIDLTRRADEIERAA